MKDEKAILQLVKKSLTSRMLEKEIKVRLKEEVEKLADRYVKRYIRENKSKLEKEFRTVIKQNKDLLKTAIEKEIKNLSICIHSTDY